MSGRIVFLLPLLVAFAPSATADWIGLHTEHQVGLRDGRCVVEGITRNEGDATAYEVTLEARLAAGGSVASTLPASIAPQAARPWALDLGPAPSPHGTHAVIVETRYVDAAGVPDAHLVWPSLALETAEPATADAIALQSGGRPTPLPGSVVVRVTNRTDRALSVRLDLHTPATLVGEEPASVREIPPHGAITADVRVATVAAARDAHTHVQWVARWEQDGRAMASVARARVQARSPTPWTERAGAPLFAAGAACWVLWLGLQVAHRRRPPALPAAPTAGRTNRLHSLWRGMDRATGPAVVGGCTLLVLAHLAPEHLLRDTLTIGGDTPAHHYLASHAARALAAGRGAIGWATGWWCGFPVFQYYFPLPYLLMAALGCVLPPNIAFKLVAVAGMVLLPLCAAVAARRMRLAAPAPALLGTAMLLVLFVPSHVHTMWGANVYSTLAGMIANSVSFALFLLLFGSAVRDAQDARFRLRTVALAVALLGTHFFTSVMAALALVPAPFLAPRGRRIRALGVLVAEAAAAGALMAWWLVPLVAKRAYAVDFGENWPLTAAAARPPLWPWLLAAAAAGLACRDAGRGVRALLIWMGGVALALFFLGHAHVSPVFVNVRLWPFAHAALAAAAAGGLAAWLRRGRHAGLAAIGTACLVSATAVQTSAMAGAWARWNFAGAEARPAWPVYRSLLETLRGQPGRLAGDLHEANEALGSSRILELAPHLVGMPTIEGGIVNSALGAYAAYAAQCLTSDACAGLPLGLAPLARDAAAATRLLDRLDVRHYLARSPDASDALLRTGAWRVHATGGPWTLLRREDDAPGFVTVLDGDLPALRTGDLRAAARAWLQNPAWYEHPVAWLPPDAPEDLPGLQAAWPAESVARFAAPPVGPPPAARAGAVQEVSVTDNGIAFRTTAIGRPHLIAMSWFPNWRVVQGAHAVVPIAPALMLVVPHAEQVELRYRPQRSDQIGAGISLLALAAVLGGAATTVGRARQRRPAA